MTLDLVRRGLARLALAVAVAGCGAEDRGPGGTSAGGAGGGAAGGAGGAGGVAAGGAAGGLEAGSDAPVDPGPYPAGPYGNAVGDTLANLAWEGYVNETGAARSDTLPYVDSSSDGMRTSGRAYGLIHLSAFT